MHRLTRSSDEDKCCFYNGKPVSKLLSAYALKY